MSLPPNIQPDRDEARRRAAADPLFGSAVRAADAAGVGECLDVETLGLYSDRVLRGAALVSAQAHIERCERCRSIVSFVEQSDTAVAGATAAGGVWAWLTGWRWLVPAASVAAVAVLAVWVNRGPANDADAPVAQATAVVERPEVAPPAPAAAAPSALRDGVGAAPGQTADALERARPNAALAAAAAAAGRDAASAAPAREKAAADAMARQRATGGAVTPADEGRVAESERVANFEMRRPAEPTADRSASVPAAAPPAAPPPSSPAAPRPAAAAGSADVRAEATARQAPAIAGAAETQVAAPRMAESVAAKRADAPATAWRVQGGGVQGLRAGVWQPIALPDGVSVIAISSPSRSVCWAIGATDILRTWNGDTWTRVALPETSESLRAISATDASTATVTTASGVRFRTTNGGASWTQL